MDIFAKRLREVLAENKMSQGELARRIKKSHDAVNDYCRGRSTPPIIILVEICKILNEKSDYLLGLED